MKTLTSFFNAFFLSFFVTFFWVSGTQAEIINIKGDYSTIQAGINASSDGDTVLVAEGTYLENINFMGKAITLASLYIRDGDTSHISKTIIDGSSPVYSDTASTVRFVSGEDTTSVLCGFTITGGSGIKKITDKPSIARYGGGIFLDNSGAKICHNHIESNVMEFDNVNSLLGGGILIGTADSDINIIIRENIIRNNRVKSVNQVVGAGICMGSNGNVNVLIEGNLIQGNTATTTGTTQSAHGGGINMALDLPAQGNIIVRNNVICWNSVWGMHSQGGAIDVMYYEPGGEFTDTVPCPRIYNNLIFNNTSQDIGGGFRIITYRNNHSPNTAVKPQPAVINNTIVDNSARDGCGMAIWNAYPLILNNIIWNDLGAIASQEFLSNQPLFAYYNDVQFGMEGEGNIDVYPDFEADSFNLKNTSPCLCAGIESYELAGYLYHAPLYDLDGNTRPNPENSQVDMGAVESDYILSVKDIINLKNPVSVYPNPFRTSLTVELKENKIIQQIEVINLDGRVIKIIDQLQASTANIQRGSLTSGIYFLRIHSDRVYTAKIIIE